MSWFIPDYAFATYRDITPEFLSGIGVKALLIDIDNTLAPYEQDLPDEHIVAWFDAIAKNGIKATLVSNNGRERVELFNSRLGLPAYFKSGKPFAKNLKRAMRDMGSDKSNTAMLGDQVLTDVVAGRHIGLRAIIVPPIKDRTSAFFRFKRALEVGSIKKYVKKAKKRGDSTQNVCGDAEKICAFWLEGRYTAKYLKNQRKIEEK